MAKMEHLCTWLEQETGVSRVPASQGCSSHVWCQKDIRTQELAKEVNLVASLPEKYPPWHDSDWGQPAAPTLPGTDVPLKSNRSAEHEGTTSSCLILDSSFDSWKEFQERGRWGGHSDQQGLAVRVLWPPLGSADTGTDPYVVHINVL